MIIEASSGSSSRFAMSVLYWISANTSSSKAALQWPVKLRVSLNNENTFFNSNLSLGSLNLQVITRRYNIRCFPYYIGLECWLEKIITG